MVPASSAIRDAEASGAHLSGEMMRTINLILHCRALADALIFDNGSVMVAAEDALGIRFLLRPTLRQLPQPSGRMRIKTCRGDQINSALSICSLPACDIQYLANCVIKRTA